MDSPKRMAKSITGRNASMGPVPWRPDEGAGVAPLEDRHQDAQGGADGKQVHHGRRERDHEMRKTVIKKRKERITTRPMKSGSFELSTFAKSM